MSRYRVRGWLVALLATTAIVALAAWASASHGAESAPPGPQSIEAGGAQTCAVTVASTLVCFGDDSAGQVGETPEGEFRSVSAGGAFACAVRTDGTPACWGDDSSGQVSETPEGEFRSVSAGGAFACGVRSDGTLACWGDDSSGQTSNAPAGEFRSVSAGGAFACGVRSDGTLACWGDDSSGQVSDMPVDTDDRHTHGHWFWNGHAFGHLHHEDHPRFVQVSAGGAHACAVEVDGGLDCWGDNEAGQASDLPDGEFASVAAGGEHSCAVRADGALRCWGQDSDGQAEPPEGSFLAVSAGGAHSCALAGDGSGTCWGDNEAGQAQPRFVGGPPPNGLVGDAYAHTFATTPQSPPPVFHLAGGQLPPGLALSAGGELTGTPTATGTFAFTVAAANGIVPDAELEASVTIVAPPTPPAAAVVEPEPTPGLPPPVAGKTVNVKVAGGTVRTKCPGKAARKLLSPEQIPIECLIDVRHGTVDLESSTGQGADTRSGFFWGGVFGVLQTAPHNWETELRLAGRLKCEKRKQKGGGARASRRRHKRGGGGGRKLWGSGKGNFKTSGNYGSASVRGTTWLVIDRCDNSTLFKVGEGTVWVRDFVKHKQVILHTGQTYVAKAAIPRLR